MTPEEVSAEAIESIEAIGILPSDSEGGATVIQPDININTIRTGNKIFFIALPQLPNSKIHKKISMIDKVNRKL